MITRNIELSRSLSLDFDSALSGRSGVPERPYRSDAVGPENACIIVDTWTYGPEVTTQAILNAIPFANAAKHLTVAASCAEHVGDLLELGASYIHRTCPYNLRTIETRQPAITRAINHAIDAVDNDGNPYFGTLLFVSDSINDATFHGLLEAEEAGLDVIVATSSVVGHTSEIMLSNLEIVFLDVARNNTLPDCGCDV